MNALTCDRCLMTFGRSADLAVHQQKHRARPPADERLTDADRTFLKAMHIAAWDASGDDRGQS
jgi:hypothetical protein